EMFSKAVELNPRMEDAYHEIGNIYTNRLLYDKAMPYYEKALKINSNMVVTIDRIGYCMMRKGRHVEAVEKFKEATSLDPREVSAYKDLIEAYLYLERYNEIDEIHRKLRELELIDKDVNIRYLLVKAKIYSSHRAYLEKGKGFSPLVSDIYKAIGLGDYVSKDIKSVLGFLTRDFLSEGNYLRAKDENQTALLRYESVLDIDPGNEKAIEGVYFVKKFLHLSERPHFCALSIVFRCMMRCKMCRIWKDKATDELPIESWKRIIDELAEFMDKNKTINFAGGEPLLKEGLIDLISYARKKGFEPAICTNGWLIDEDMAKRLVDSGIDIVAISLDSLNGKIHDYLRGVRGSHKRVMDAIGYLNKHNKDKKIRIHVQPIISEVNLEDLMELTHWVNRHEGIGDITFLAIIQPPNTNSDYQEWYKKREFKILWPKNIDRVDSVMSELARLKKSDAIRGYKIGNQVFQFEAYKEYFRNPAGFYKRKVQCNIGTQFINIHTNGDVKLCHYSDIVIGNVAKQKIQDIWNSELANSVRDKIKLCDKKCHQILNCIKDEDPYL
ncbi:MAG: radical SAM protein, partial [Candidatus Omnitrophica bacterium]|nr:radical SAM protein [Candidatus Omnitrophota bacterium]